MSAQRFDPERTTPLGMLRYAIEFFAASTAVDDRFGDQACYELHAPVPALFLLARSVELALKAYLLQKTTSFDFVHNLVRLLAKAEEAGLENICDGDRRLVAILNNLYDDKQLEYIKTGAKTLPMYGSTEDLAKRLLLGIASEIPQGYRLLESKEGEILKA